MAGQAVSLLTAQWQTLRASGLACTALCLCVLTLSGYALVLGQRSFDDPFITYRYASNLLAGHGLVYNVGERVLSTTAPLYAILLAGLGALGGDLPLMSSLIGAASLAASAVLLATWPRGNQADHRAAALIAALLLSLFPLVLATLGAETCLLMALVLGALWAYNRDRLLATSCLVALATMIRPEGAVAALALGAYHLARRRPIRWRPVLVCAGLVAIWYAGLSVYFGSPVPLTLLAKRQQALMTGSEPFGPGLVALLRSYGRQPLFWTYGVLAMVGLGRVVARAKHWLPLLLWAVLDGVAYSLSGVSAYFWYYAPLVPALVVLVAEGAVAVARALARLGQLRPYRVGVTMLLLVGLVAPLWQGVISLAWSPDRRLETYRQTGQWLRSHTLAQEAVGAVEVGIIGYYAQRPMVDFGGLLQPAIARQLAASRTYQASTEWAIRNYWPSYVVIPGAGYDSVREAVWFRASYTPVQSFGDEPTLWLTVYRRVEGP